MSSDNHHDDHADGIAEAHKNPPLYFHILFFGLIASGKSTLAKAWAEQKNIPYYNSDVVRKELAGLSPTASNPATSNQQIT